MRTWAGGAILVFAAGTICGLDFVFGFFSGVEESFLSPNFSSYFLMWTFFYFIGMYSNLFHASSASNHVSYICLATYPILFFSVTQGFSNVCFALLLTMWLGSWILSGNVESGDLGCTRERGE